MIGDGNSDNSFTLCDLALELSEKQIHELDWRNDEVVFLTSFINAKSLLAFCYENLRFDELLPPIVFADAVMNDLPRNKDEYRIAVNKFADVCRASLRESTEFITMDLGSLDAFQRNVNKHHAVLNALCCAEFLAAQHPYDRLQALSWIIPGVAAGQVSAIKIVSYAAYYYANIINDPIEARSVPEAAIGNSWLHQLAVYLLHHSGKYKLVPYDYLVRLVSLTASQSTKSLKLNKAYRVLEEMNTSPYPVYLHEAPIEHVVGLKLCLELCGDIDANRQIEYIRHIERAVAFYANVISRTGSPPSAKSISDASGLSWRDAKDIMNKWFFVRLVFLYQTKMVIVRLGNYQPDSDAEQEAEARRLAAPPRWSLPSSV